MPASEYAGNKDIAGAIEEVVKGLIGAERHEWWFSQDVQLVANDEQLVVLTTNRFMVDRVRRNLLNQLKSAAAEVYGSEVSVVVQAKDLLAAGSSRDTVLGTLRQPISPAARYRSRSTCKNADQNPVRNTFQPSLAGLDDQDHQPKPESSESSTPGDFGQPNRANQPNRPAGRGRKGVRVVRDEPQNIISAAKSGRGYPSRRSTGSATSATSVGPTLSGKRASEAVGTDAALTGAALTGAALGSNTLANAAGRTGARILASSSNGSGDQGPTQAQTRSHLAATSLSNFCVGPCNTLAHVAAKMVTDQPGSPSPLFFWGPAGTGKTHLLAAIRNELRNRHRLRRVVMLSAEQFTNDFTGAVRGSGLPAFRSRYRDVDALLIDDVQFVGGKRATLRELLYTVDSLLRGRCQLAFTADRPPLELDGLNEELAGRMAGGMVCPLKPLDQETRLKVLRGLAQVTHTSVHNGVLEKMAEELVGDGRILSGAFNHLRTLGAMLERPATWDELLSSAPDLISAGRPAVNLGDIQKAVCDMFGLPAGSLSSRGQHRSLSEPRMLAMYLARQYTRAAFSEIGQFFGDRSHSTVIAATKRVESWLTGNKPLRRGPQSLAPRQAIEAIENLLRTG